MSSCDVCIGTIDEDYDCQFMREIRQKARKPQECCECGRYIPAGMIYVKIVGKWDGDFGDFRQCVECHEIQKVFACGKNYLFTQLWEDMDEAFESLTTRSPCLWMLSNEARAFLTEKWWEWKWRHPA